MQFGPVPVSSAHGAVLAHALRAGSRQFKKGRVLSAADIEALAAAGYREVTVARLEDCDVAEDAAAARIAAALAGDRIRVGAAFTGRANLYALSRGLAVIDAERIAMLNAIDEAITVATLSPYAVVELGQMVATVKIIPFAAPGSAMAAASDLLGGCPALRVAPFVPKRVALIATRLADTWPASLTKNRGALDRRLAPLGSSIVSELRVAHETAALADALGTARASSPELILILGASAITDRRDVIPDAIGQAGGVVERFGMPVDPGNLLLLGHLDGMIVIGLPGCARSPKLNGFDFVLQRVLADISIGRAEFAAMGVGGLLTEIHSRPQPRDQRPVHLPRAPRIAVVILAAGLSSRMGRNKLLAEIDGMPLLRRVAEAAIASSAGPVILVTGNEADDVERTVSGLPLSIARNDDFRRGLSASLICGINAVPEDCDGVLVLLGDMPGVTCDLIDRLIAAFAPEDGRAICVATHDGKRGNPVLWARQFFPDIRKLEGDVGAKSLIGENEELVCDVEAPDDGPLLDIDTPEALVAYIDRSR
ncbi:MAG: NTP transferase domain-containing protein [Rhizomicrobium sp.]